ncbi:MAG: carboxylesterase family protein [Actinomycetota bacterium]
MARTDRPEVTVTQGRLRGKAAEKGTVSVFKGIPFAAPPVGDLRWRPPQEPASWTGVRDAAKHGPMAIQREAQLETFLRNLLAGQGWGRYRVGALMRAIKYAPGPAQREDCLYLTVRTPDRSPSARLPVMVWIHGGDHQDGSGADPYYDVNTLATKGVVTVSINYRLGVFGYLAHPELRAESDHDVAGNYGTLDQIAALRWVRDNIEAFGGDPGNVTIFGESAGGESVIHLLSSPLARGLFHRAIAQSPANSGQMIHLDRPFVSHRAATDLSVRFASAVGVTGGRDQLSRLRAIPADRIKAVAAAEDELGGFFPVIDGHVLPRSPFATFAAGEQAPVPFLIGSNADEGSLLQPVLGAPMIDFRLRPLPERTLQPEIADAFGDDLPQLLANYPGLDRRDPTAEVDFMGDHMFGARAYYYARHHHRAGHPVHLYFFTRVPPGPKQTAGAYHAAEVPFVHGTSLPIFPMTDADWALSAEMIRYWVDLARTGDPNGDGSGGPAHPVWPRFDEADPRWLVFDHTIQSHPVDRREVYELFNARTDRLVTMMAEATT